MIGRSLLLLIALGAAQPVFAEDEFTVIALDVPAVPAAVAQAMQVRAAAWTLPRFLKREVREHCLPPGAPAYPYLASGDFDGDGATDHAFWAVEGEGAMTLLVHESRGGRLVALDRAHGEQMHLEPVTVARRGTLLYDHHTGRSRRLAHVAPGALACGKSSRAWIRTASGTYQELLTSD